MTPDYGAIGTAIAIGYIAFMDYRQRKTSKVVNEIHALTNSAMTQQKKTLAEVTAAKSVITKDPKDVEAATEAMKDYLSSVNKQSNVESQTK
jgi:hypothetical protein